MNHSKIPMKLVLFVTAVPLVAVVVFFVNWKPKPPRDEVSLSPVPEQKYSFPNALTDRVIKELMDSGWDREAATALLKLNGEFFTLQEDENPNGLEKNIKFLKGLGKHPEIQPLIKQHPELALLLAGAENPHLIAEVFDSIHEDYERLVGIFQQYCDTRDATFAALAFKNNREVIFNLQKKGVISPEVLFTFAREGAGFEEYEKWLRDELKSRQNASPEEFSSFLVFILNQGPGLRRRLNEKESFRGQFREVLWPRFIRAAGDQKDNISLFLNDERVWDLLALDKGEILLKDCGSIATDLLFGIPTTDQYPYPQELHPQVIQILLSKKEVPISALMKFRGNQLFYELLKRSIAPSTLSAALNKVFESGGYYQEKLKQFSKLSDTALAEEVGPEPSGVITWIPFYYTVYEIPKKVLQGRTPTGMDLVSGTLDIVFLVPDLLSAGATTVPRKALVMGTKEGVKTIEKELAGKAVVASLREAGLELATKKLTKSVAGKLSDKELTQWTVTATLLETKKWLAEVLGKAVTFEITKPVKLMFELSGVGRESMKKWTGLEARVFMRGDARVFVRLDKVPEKVLGPKGAKFFANTAENMAIGAASETKIAEEAIRLGVSTAIKTKEELEKLNWQRHVSAWWFINNSYSPQ